MKTTRIRHKRRCIAPTEDWVLRTADFLREYDGSLFIIYGGFEAVLCSREHPTDQVIESWFRDGSFRCGEIEVTRIDDAPAEINIPAVIAWIDGQDKMTSLPA